MDKRMLVGLAAAVALAFVPLTASAGPITEITFTQLDAEALGKVDPQKNPEFDLVFIGGSGGVFENVTGSVTNVRRSPFDTAEPDPNDNANKGLYTSVGANVSGTYNFASMQRALSMIWGSPDTYNTLTLFRGDTTVAKIIPGPETNWPLQPLGVGAWQLMVSDTEGFDRVTFHSGNNAFEFANFETVPVPEPSMLALLGAGLLALVGLRRRKVA